jgi:ribosomal protein L37AE/L43A
LCGLAGRFGDSKTIGSVRTMLPFKQQQRENCACGRFRMQRVRFSLFCLFCDTCGMEKKTVSQERPTELRIRTVPMGTDGDLCQQCYNTTTTTKHRWSWRGNTTAVAGVVVWPGVGASRNTTTTNHGRTGVGDSSLYCARYSLRGYV